MTPPLVLSIAFLEANAATVILRLCERYELEPTEANAKVALKRLAVEAVVEGNVNAAERGARAEPPPG